MNLKKKYIIIFVTPLLLSLLFLYFDDDGSSVKADAFIYFTIAKNIVAGHGFSDSVSPPYLSTMSREPVYPLLLSVILYFFTDSILAVQLFQVLIYALTCVIVFKIISSLLSDRKLSFIISLVVSIFPTIASYTPHLITEVLFTFLLALSVLSLVKSFEGDNLKWYFLSGVILGTATLCKAVLMMYFIFIIIVIFLHHYKKYVRDTYKKIMMPSLLLMFGYMLIVMPWMSRNYLLLDKFAITVRGYGSMYTRAVKVNLDNDELKMYALYSISEYLAGKLYPQYNLTSTGGGYFYQPVKKKITEYSGMGISQEEADSLYRAESMTLIRSHPIKFAVLGIFEIIKFNSFSQILLLNEKKTENVIGSPYIYILRGILKLIGFLVFVFACIGIIVTYKNWHEWIVPFSVVIYFNFVHSFVDAIGRYAVPIIPYYLFFSVLGIKGIKYNVYQFKRQ